MNPWGSNKEKRTRANDIACQIRVIEEQIRKAEEPWKLKIAMAAEAGGEVEQNLRNAYFGSRSEEYRIARQEIASYRLAIDSLKEDSLRYFAEQVGLDIPEKYLTDPNGDYPRFTSDGKNWVRREVGRLRREWVKDWIAVIAPFASFIISVLALLLALTKR